MNKKILITAELDNESLEYLKNNFDVILTGRAAGASNFFSEDEMINEINKYEPEVLIISADPITHKVIDSCNSVKLIIVTRGNPVNVDLKSCSEKNVIVTNTPSRNANCVAEMVIAMIINLSRNIFPSVEAVKNGKVSLKNIEDANKNTKDVIWSSKNLEVTPYLEYRGFDIEGKTLGLIGLGAIGKKVLKKALCLGMNILVYDPYIEKFSEENKIKKVDLDYLLKNSDFVSLHCKVTEETKNMISADELNEMKSTAYLINTARGALIDHNSLYKALKDKTIAGAAVDVFYYEPIAKDDPFLKLENFIITPHIGGASSDVIKHHSRMVLESLNDYVDKKEVAYRKN